MSLSKSETDIILNKANIALARSQRLVASWLPVQQTSAEQDLSNAKTDEELQREEDEIFTAVPERYVYRGHFLRLSSQSVQSATDLSFFYTHISLFLSPKSTPAHQ
jgi:hypothetical protein